MSLDEPYSEEKAGLKHNEKHKEQSKKKKENANSDALLITRYFPWCITECYI